MLIGQPNDLLAFNSERQYDLGLYVAGNSSLFTRCSKTPVLPMQKVLEHLMHLQVFLSMDQNIMN